MKRINDVVYRIRKGKGKTRVVHFNRLPPFVGDHSNEAQLARVRPPPHNEWSFEVFLTKYGANHKARFGVTKEEQRNLFTVLDSYSLAHCRTRDLHLSRGIATSFEENFGHLNELKQLETGVGRTLEVLASKGVWDALRSLRDNLLERGIMRLAIARIACGLDGLSWRIIRSIIEVLFWYTGIHIVCSWNPRQST